jgi:hypothetical protein
MRARPAFMVISLLRGAFGKSNAMPETSASLLRILHERLRPMPERDAARDRILSLAASRPSPTRAQSRQRARGLLVLAVVAAAAIFQAAGGVAHSAGRPLGFTLGIAAGATALAVFASTFALGRGRTMTGRPRPVLVTLSLAVPVLTMLWLVAWSGQYVEPFARIGYRCLGLTLAIGLLLLGTAVVVRRRTVAATPSATGAAIGGAAGAWAGVAVDLWCPLTNAAHAAIGHVAPMLLLVTSGALLGHGVLRVRAASS